MTVDARSDMIDIRRFSIEQFGGDVADKYFMGFDAAFELLERHPLAGQPREAWGRGIRAFHQRRHRIVYRVEGDEVLIVRVLHHAQDVKLTLKKVAR